MLGVIIFHFLKMLNLEIAMMNCEMEHIIQHIPNSKSTEQKSAKSRTKEEVVECCQDEIHNHSQNRRENKSVRVHWNLMMNAMNDVMQQEKVWIVGKEVFKMEKISVKHIF